ncbi:hypothetical protein H5T51_01135 [Candidatus Bathyarchaeota archaeon]|nr:hypothetical protein [Candidatus Bathyarchaeota archaeon]
MVISAYLLVESASYLAVAFGIPPVVVGETIIAFGTSLPELVTSVNSVQRGHLDLALGNIIGSCFTNTTLILGATLVSSPFTLNMMAFTNLVIFSIIINLMLWYFLSSEKISWREGVVLLFLYVIFMISSFSGYKA